MSKSSRSGVVVWVLVVVLLILHQDNWFWDNPKLIFGFMPITLLYHAGISIAAGITWFIATKIAWPEFDEVAPESTKGGAET